MYSFQHMPAPEDDQLGAWSGDRNIQPLWLEEELSQVGCKASRRRGQRNHDRFALLTLHPLDGIHNQVFQSIFDRYDLAQPIADQPGLSAVGDNNTDLLRRQACLDQLVHNLAHHPCFFRASNRVVPMFQVNEYCRMVRVQGRSPA
jgi:hypothetical protein